MKLNEVSDEYRRLREQEIVEENLFSEKEVQIDKLIQINVYLKAEYIKSEEEREKMKKAYYEEIEKFQKTIEEFEDLIQKEAEDKQKIKAENEKVSKLLNSAGEKGQSSNRLRENQFDQSVQGYQNEIYDLKQEIEQLTQKNNEKDEVIAEMGEDLTKIEKSYNQLVGDYNGLKDILSQNQETDARNEEGFSGLQEKLFNAENELKKANASLHAVLVEKADLIKKSEDIAAQAKQV